LQRIRYCKKVEGRIHVYKESNSWPAASRATTKKSIDYTDDLEETNNGLECWIITSPIIDINTSRGDSNRTMKWTNGRPTRKMMRKSIINNRIQQGDGLSAAPAGHDTMHYQLTTYT
jgi:hypothetical protein